MAWRQVLQSWIPFIINKTSKVHLPVLQYNGCVSLLQLNFSVCLTKARCYLRTRITYPQITLNIHQVTPTAIQQ